MSGWHVSEALEELVRRIRDGEVVFFVGAGFSVDSEGVTGQRVVRRLLLRLKALDAVQVEGSPAMGAFARFVGTFESKPGLSLSEIAGSWATVDRLAARYYEVNEWMCRAYGELLAHAAPVGHAEFVAALKAAEDEARRESGWTRESFEPVPVAWWAEGRASAADPERRTRLGKLLFVQSLGFFDPRVMAGTAFDGMRAAGSDEIERSYADRLRPRHHVLARWAREGFCPVLLTANFDLLLEGAFRLAGFVPAPLGRLVAEREAEREGGVPAPTAIPWFDVIASPSAFFRRGKAYRTATLLKLHGCAGYLRGLQGADEQIAYLRHLIYTYREIQNWRDDSWAADYLRTLLRTRTMVLAGYSTADPVMHDTFRGIYEEMARKSAGNTDSLTDGAGFGSTEAREARAPAYFLAFSDQDESHEFHGNEVLRAATAAVGGEGEPASRKEHRNYLRFAPAHRGNATRFQLDEMFLWMQHRVLRQQQREAVRSELPTLIARLDGRRPPEECREIERLFEDLMRTEAWHVEWAEGGSDARRRLRELVGWSGGFQVALRREWARGLVLAVNPARREVVRPMEHALWYYPASERPAWTAWGAVLELALRRLGAWATRHWSGADLPPGLEPVEPSGSLRPTVFFRQGPRATAPRVSLTLQLRGFDRPGRRPDVPGAPARRVIWLMREDDLPWCSPGRRGEEDERERKDERSGLYLMGPDCWRLLPSAERIWNLALGREPEAAEIEGLLGGGSRA